MVKNRKGRLVVSPKPAVVALPAPLDRDAFIAAVAEQAERLFGFDWREELAKASTWAGREARRAQADDAEAERMGAVAARGRKALKDLGDYDRVKPTREQAGKGAYLLIDAAKLDSARKGERVLVNLQELGGGAGELYKRGAISARQFKAACELCELHQLAHGSQLGGATLQEKVDGGRMQDGGKLLGAVHAARHYEAAMRVLPPATRALIERRILLGLAMKDAVNAPAAYALLHRLDPKNRAERAKFLIEDGLSHLADHFGLASERGA